MRGVANLGVVVLVVPRETCCGPVGCPFWDPPVCRQPVRAVGESPVMLSPHANVLVSLSSVKSILQCVTAIPQPNCDSCVLWRVGIFTNHDLTTVILP